MTSKYSDMYTGDFTREYDINLNQRISTTTAAAAAAAAAAAIAATTITTTTTTTTTTSTTECWLIHCRPATSYLAP